MEGRRRPHDGAAANYYGHVMVSGWWLVVDNRLLVCCGVSASVVGSLWLLLDVGGVIVLTDKIQNY